VSEEQITASAVQERLDRLSAIFEEMMVTVDDLATRRCPYKNRVGECTAAFGCRNQRPPMEGAGRRICGGDDRLDYRSAWEST
jgi:hypothetical protein